MDQQADPSAHQPLRPRSAVAVWTELDRQAQSKAWDRRGDPERHAAFMTAEMKGNAALWHELADAGSAYHDSSR
jgi:hypothetical protein